MGLGEARARKLNRREVEARAGEGTDLGSAHLGKRDVSSLVFKKKVDQVDSMKRVNESGDVDKQRKDVANASKRGQGGGQNRIGASFTWLHFPAFTTIKLSNPCKKTYQIR